MSQIYDFSTHITLFKKFHLLNNFFLKLYKEKGDCISFSFNKININDNNIIEKLNQDLKYKEPILFSQNLS